MNQICLVLPVRLGRTGRAGASCRSWAAPRRVDHDRFERRLGIRQAVWYVAGTPLGNLLVGYLDVDDLDRAAALLSRPRDDFDRWSTAGLRDATGIDLSAGERIPLPELLCSWTAAVSTNAVDRQGVSPNPPTTRRSTS